MDRDLQIFTYVLRLGDDNLILAQRLSELISWAPELEQDIAVANISLDHLGQARALLQHAAAIEGGGRSEDDLAMFRSEREMTNALLVEQPNGDFAQTMVRQFLFDAYQLPLWEALTGSADGTLAGIAAKAHKETRYHLRHSSTWVIRLGDGTEESNRRCQRALEALWRFTAELFESDHVDRAAIEAGVGVDASGLHREWSHHVGKILAEATLTPPADGFQTSGGRTGAHSEHLGHILAEMQWLQRSLPGLEW